MVMRILVEDPLEFDGARSNGYVYGYVKMSIDGKMRRFSVYVRLGEETTYTGHPKDDLRKEYKRFNNCTVSYAYNDDDCDAGKFFHTDESQKTVLLIHWTKI